MTTYTHDDGDYIGACRALHDDYTSGLLSRDEYLAAFQRLDATTGVACDHCGAKPATITTGQRVLCSRCHLARNENETIARRSSVLSWVFIALLLLALLALGALAGWFIVAGVFSG